MKKILVAAALATLAACTSVPVDLATAPHVPAERIFKPDVTTPSPGRVEVVVSLDLKAISSCCVHIALNGERLADIDSGEVLKVYVLPGRNAIEMNIGNTEAFRSVVSETMDSRYGPYRYRVALLDSRYVLQPDTR